MENCSAEMGLPVSPNSGEVKDLTSTGGRAAARRSPQAIWGSPLELSCLQCQIRRAEINAEELETVPAASGRCHLLCPVLLRAGMTALED